MTDITGNASANKLSGTPGDDKISGLGGNDTLTGLGGNDALIGGVGNDTLDGGDGNDLYKVGLGDGFDLYKDTGTTGTDTIVATADNVAIGLQSGFGPASGIETISNDGHAGVTIAASSWNDTLNFSATTLVGIFAIDGGAGNDTITGSAGADIIIGGAGNDILNGGEGNDAYFVGIGAGSDTYQDTGATGKDSIIATADNVVIGLMGFASTGIEDISASGHAGVTIAGTTGNNSLNFTGVTLAGITAIDGGVGNDTITGSSGADTIIGNTGNDTLNGGDGGDTYLIGLGAGLDSIKDTGASGTDSILATADNTVIGLTALSGIEAISANGHAGVTVASGTSNDTLSFATTTLTGIVEIDGGSGNDTITGSAGADKLIGGAGNDTMKGGGAADLFVYASGADKIQDFLHGTDHIDVTATGVFDFATLQSFGRQMGVNAVFTFSAGNTLTLMDVKLNTLTGDDFGFSSNQPPSFTSVATGSEAENTATSNVVYQATVSDHDGGPTVFSLDTGGDNDLFSINASTGEVTFKNSPDFENPQDAGGDNTYNIVVHANDGVNDSTKSVAIGVTDLNDNSPVTGADAILTNVAGAIDFAVPEWALLANDSAKYTNTVLQISAVSNATGGELGSFTSTSGTSDLVTYQTTGSGAHAFDYSASDGVHATDGTVTVTRVNGSTVQGGAADEILVGTDGVDSLFGADGANILLGGGGADDLRGDWGASVVHSGNNTIDGGAGDDSIAGGLGSDTLTGGGGNDSIVGYSAYFGDDPSDGNDKINGGTGDDSVLGGSGDDALIGDDGSDALHGDDGNDSLDGGSGNDSLHGDNGDDRLDDGVGDNELDGGNGSDTITAGSGNDTIYADENDADTGVDHVTAGGGDDTVTFLHYDVGDSADGGAGFDTLFLTLTGANDTFDVAAQTIFINFDKSFVAGGGGDDVLTGSGGQEKFYGDSGPGIDGNDTVNGLGGDDNIDGGGGNNTLNGGDGNDFIEGDAFSQTPGVGDNTIDGGNGDDYIAGGNGSDTLTGGDGNDAIYGYSAFYFGDNGADGKDNIDGGKGDDFVTGGSGNDTIAGGTGTDNLQGGDGDDTITTDTSSTDTDTDFAQGGDGNDTVTFLHYDSGDTADGGAGSFDVLNLYFGGEGNSSGDVIGSVFTNFERVNLHGGGGNDTLTGLGGADQLFGDDGNDLLTGVGSNAALTGGAGSDTFEYTSVSSGADTITDFIHASDVIDVNAIDADTGTANDQDFAFVVGQNSGTVANSITWFQDTLNNQTVIRADNTGDATADLTIVLQGKIDLTATDFHL